MDYGQLNVVMSKFVKIFNNTEEFNH